MTIIISKNGKNAMRLEKSSFKGEAELQKYICYNPESILLPEIKENVQFIVIDREFHVGVGSIDVLGVDNEGDIYIIETKLFKNPDKRFVLAQVLDYGASLWSYDPDDFIERVDQKLREKTGKGIIEKLDSVFGNGEEIVNNIKQNLLTGAFKFIILLDRVPSNLKDLILFINQNSQFSIYAVELEYYTYESYDILIPHVFGAESKKKPVSEVKRKRWDEESFFKDAKEKLDAEVYNAVKKLYNYSKEKADEIAWGTGTSTGSFNPKFYAISVRSIYSVRSDGVLTINFGWLDDNEYTRQWREKLRKELREMRSIADYISKTGDKFPIIPPKVWTPVVDDFINTMTKLLEGR